PFDMHFVDDRLVPGQPDARVAIPVEAWFMYDAFRHERRAVGLAHYVVFRADLVREHRVVPGYAAVNRFRVGIEQELVWVAALSLQRPLGSMHAIAIQLPQYNAGQVTMQAMAGDFRQGDPGFALAIEEAKLDSFGNRREQGKVGAFAAKVRAERIGDPR